MNVKSNDPTALVECVKVGNRFLQVAFVLGAVMVIAIDHDFKYQTALPAYEAVLFVLLVGTGPALLLDAWLYKRHPQHSLIRQCVTVFAVIALVYGLNTHKADISVTGAVLVLQITCMRMWQAMDEDRTR